MKSSARSLNAQNKQGSHGTERAKAIPTIAFGMRTSRSTNSLAFESRLSKLKRASSDDMLTKPGGSAAITTSRLKKTITTGGISELSESRFRTNTGLSAARRTGIPTPRELPTQITRDRTTVRVPTPTAKKTLPSPTSPSNATPKSIRAPSKPKQENESNTKSGLELQVKELLAEAKTKDFEISKLQSELQKCKGPEILNLLDTSVEMHLMQGSDPELLMKTLQDKNIAFQQELSLLRQENKDLKEKLNCFEQSPLSDTITSNGTDSSLISPSTQGTSMGNKARSPLVGGSEINHLPGEVSGLHISGSSSSDVTKASLSPDSDFEHISDVPSRPGSSGSIPCQGSKCSTSGSSPNNVSDLSVASLTERIHKMEENQHSTAEELQATLQELSDQNLMVQELTMESEKLVEEKAFLESSLQQQRQRAEQLSQENEKLMTLLQERSKTEEAQVQSKLFEMEKKHTELVEQSQFEREKLLNIQQQLTSSLRSLEKEHQEAQVMIKRLKEEIGKLQNLLDIERKEKCIVSKGVEDQKVITEGLKIEINCLKAQLDGERQKVPEITPVATSNPENSLSQEGLKTVHVDKEHLELTCSELRQELLKANSEVKQLQCLLAKVETECHDLKELGDQREEQLKSMNVKLLEKSSEIESEVKDMKDTIFELEDQVEQHRAVKLHNNQIISDLENKVDKLEEHKQDLERQLKLLNKQMKEDSEEWKRFQADLQTAVVVANDIKCEAQQELRAVKRRLQEEEERSAHLHRELEDMRGSRKLLSEEPGDGVNSIRWQSHGVGQVSTTSNDNPATVKSLIKSFDVGPQGGGSPNIPVHSVPRSPLSGIPVRTAPAAAVSPMQRLSASSIGKLSSKDTEKQLDISDKLKGQREDLTPDRFPRKSPSLESLNTHTSLNFGSRNSSPFALDSLSPQSKLSVERKDPLAALAREYGGSKRNALLKWCQKKTEGYSNIDITNFSSSWSDGLAFCALLHTYMPAHIPYHELNSQDKKRNLMLAFQAAESIGIKASLELNELMFTDRPDWQSVMQYVSQIYKYFET
ncbi:cytospin-B isoform X3 [Hyla sarda]|nr:cytospin-B isoform X3 [Hyla sarda]XP_056415120.1 cytospin-B isoform X3 [Hyla sarda]XP_056415121.1 cytospin-B isoform X3 [Hyla sarda]